jgi:hypothetical protein
MARQSVDIAAFVVVCHSLNNVTYGTGLVARPHDAAGSGRLVFGLGVSVRKVFFSIPIAHREFRVEIRYSVRISSSLLIYIAKIAMSIIIS